MHSKQKATATKKVLQTKGFKGRGGSKSRQFIQAKHPATLIKQASIDPGSLTPGDVLQLQRTIGNKATALGAVEGHWSATGTLYFTKTDPATQGFTRNNPNTHAHHLLSSTTAPAGLGVARLHRYAQGTWDSTGTTPTHTGSAGP